VNAEIPLKVALLAGGRSSEHDVSLASGRAVSDGLLAGGHEVLWVEIDREGSWRHEGERLSVCPGDGLLEADVVFPVLHGPFGEDGTVQGLLETLDVAYVGAGVAAAALCMDKVIFKELMTACEVPQVDYVGVREERWRRDPEAIIAEIADLGLPVFVKPAHLGSSVGIVKVDVAEQLSEALQSAFVHDALVIVEALAPGIEVECAVVGRPRAEREDAGATLSSAALACEPGEVCFQGDWYDFAAKYTPGGMELIVPARISASARARVCELAVEAFVYTGCEGLARVDFFVDDEQVLLNELNTMPGFTPTSVYAKLAAASGIAYPQLVDRLCRLALERHAERRSHAY
jgi:D-alanine-D-alanine ligase